MGISRVALPDVRTDRRHSALSTLGLRLFAAKIRGFQRTPLYHFLPVGVGNTT
jgi:hypothetical protein